MACRDGEPVDSRGTQQGEMIGRIGAQTAPKFDDFGIRELGNQFLRRGENLFDAAGGDTFIEPGVLETCCRSPFAAARRNRAARCSLVRNG